MRPEPNAYNGFVRIGSSFGRRVRSSLSRRSEQHWENTIFFAYDTGFLEPAAWAKERGAINIVGQMDPSRTEFELVQEEEKLWPGWARRPLLVPPEYLARRDLEWALADAIMVNSPWTLDALVKQGVPAAKIHVVPLAYEAADTPPTSTKAYSEPLRVLFLGQVNLRKGIPYLLEAARKLKNQNIQIDIVGPIDIADEQVVKAAPHVHFHGSVSRDHVRNFYSRSDVFVLPTISDGFALTQLEAMAHGLPVIATPNCGRVVTDGVDGFLIPSRDSASLADRLMTLRDDPERLEAMREAARLTVKKFSLDQLSDNLRTLESKLKTPSQDEVPSFS